MSESGTLTKRGGNETSEKEQGYLSELFKQQRMKAWQPVLTPKIVIFFFLGIGIVILIIGIVLCASVGSVIECKLRYPDPSQSSSSVQITFSKADCAGINENDSVDGPVFIYYELNRFYQNHRAYVRSFSATQLSDGDAGYSTLDDCSPLDSKDGKLLYPCGLVANSVFNDTYALTGSDGSSISVDTSADTISWSSDVKNKYKEASYIPSETNSWLNTTLFPQGIETGHFINWMRVSALPNFRKLWGKLEVDTLYFPLTVTIENNYPVAQFDGTKTVVLSTSSWAGGRSFFLSIVYLVVGSLCTAMGIFFWMLMIRKPRHLGDVNFLSNWR